MSLSRTAAHVALSSVWLLALAAAAPASAQTTVFINEIHYDNEGTDSGEAIEVAGPAGTDLLGWSIVLYNGSNGTMYDTRDLTTTIPDQGNGFGVVFEMYGTNGIQNGSPDGIALVNGSTVVQFISYEGSLTASDGPAAGMTSENIGVSESSSTAVGDSLQLSGSGESYEDFTWNAAAPNSFGLVNPGQVYDSTGGPGDPGGPGEPGPTVFVNEFHYDNAGTDTGEAIEVAGPAGTNLSGYSIVRYNGFNGSTYSDTSMLSGVLEDECQGYGFTVVEYPTNGLQNGAPDGFALIGPAGEVVQFLSYEGALQATDGPAAGETSVDVGVVENSTTPIGASLQLAGDGASAADFAWQSPADATFGAANIGQTFGDPGTSCGEPAPPPGPVETTIPAVQGNGDSSPFAGQLVAVEGIVTGDFQDGVGANGDLNGFYLQDELGDGDAATSDGIFVFDGSSPALDVNIGDRVRVVGTVDEFFGETQLDSLDGGSVTVTGAGSVGATPISLPVGTRTNSRGELIADLEAYEGMLVTFPQTLTVSELFNLDRFGEMVLAEGGRFVQFTQNNTPDPSGFAAHLENIASRSLVLDDGLSVQNPDPIRYPAPGLSTANPVRMGDTVSGVTGNLRYSRGSGGSGDDAYRLQPVIEPVFAAINERPTGIEDGDGRLRMASFNVLNFFNDLDDGTGQCFAGGAPAGCRGADSVDEFDRQAAKLITTLAALDADVIGLNEVENDYTSGADSAIAEIVDRLNADGSSSCGSAYDYVRSPNGDLVGDDAIAVGIIYCASSVTPAFDTTAAVLTDDALPELGFTPPLFTGQSTSRAPLAASFDENVSGERFTVAVNHFKSKGGSPGGCSDPATNPDCDQGDGAGNWNQRRTDSSAALIAWLATDPTGSGDDDVVILGDLNAYRQETPVTTFDDAGFVNLVEPGDYSYVFDAQTGTLDYAIVSPGLAAAVTGVDEWHINADEADGLDYNLDFGRNPSLFDPTVAIRASDHDPLVFGLDLPDQVPPAIACNAPETLSTRDLWTIIQATAFDTLDDDPDVEVGHVRCERETRWGTRRTFCLAASYEDKVYILWPGRPGTEISWDVSATDNAGNSSAEECSIDVVRGRRNRRH